MDYMEFGVTVVTENGVNSNYGLAGCNVKERSGLQIFGNSTILKERGK